MSLNDHLSSVRDRIVIIVVLAALGAGVGYLAATSQPAAYQSSSLVALGARSTEDSSLSSATQALYDRSVPSTLAQMAASSSIIAQAEESTRLTASRFEMAAVAVNDANVVEIVGQGTDPEMTRAFTAGVTAEAMKQFDQLYPLFRTVNISPATVAEDTRVPLLIATAAGALAGAFLGFLVSLAWGRRRPALNVVDRPHRQAVG